MSPGLILLCIGCYFTLLLAIAWFTSRKASDFSYFLGNKSSLWYVVALGMISDSLSGVTFISLPGTVLTDHFYYLQIVLGYLLGYLIIAKVLLPIYYKLNLTSIYGYLSERFGNRARMTGSFYFIISRTVGAGLRLYLAAEVIQLFVCDRWNIPFPVTVSSIIFLMLVYTYKGGIKTLVWTDAFQSTMLLGGLILSVAAIISQLDLPLNKLADEINSAGYTRMFNWDWREPSFFVKQFLSGAFIAVVMTGLDQNMMQKNLSCRTLPEAQKNIISFSIVLVFVNLLFVSLGALLYFFASKMNISLPAGTGGDIITDRVFPFLALNHLGLFAGLTFIIGLTAATFSSADSVLTTLTTSFMMDILQTDRNPRITDRQKVAYRHLIHIGFGILLLLTILFCTTITRTSVIDYIFKAAAYTYGPLLGLFAFGLFTKWKINDRLVPVICLFPPVLSYYFYQNSQYFLGGYKFGYELLLLNGLLTFTGLWVIRSKDSS